MNYGKTMAAGAVLLSLAFAGCTAAREKEPAKVVEKSPWGDVTVELPEIPARQFPITSYANDVNVAMTACATAGGGRVVVPKGTWLSKGPVKFRSNCALELAEGAVLEFTDDPKDYLPAVHTTWEGSECMNYSPLVYAYGCTNVAIVGRGELRPRLKGWQEWQKRPPAHQAMTAELYHWMSTNAPVAVRDVTQRNGNFRPHLIQFNRSNRILLRDFRINGSPFWTTHLYLSRNVLMEGVDSYAHGHNNDGVDVEMTQDVIIRRCRFDQGDDGVVLKAGRNQDGWRLATPTRNVVVRDCELVEGHGLLVVGSEMAGGVENVYMHHCKATGRDVHRVMYLKTNERRGGFMRRIAMEDCTAKNVRLAAFEIATDVLYQWAKLPTYEVKLTEIDDIVMRNCTIESAQCRDKIKGDPRRPVGRVTIENVRVLNPGGAIECRARARKRIAAIRATPNLTIPAGAPTYYLSEKSGDDAADGRTPKTAWRTAARLAKEKVAKGSFVLFERGGVYRGTVKVAPGVTYSAYGTGRKPRIYGSPADGADPAKWTRTDNPKVWAYDIGHADVGTLVFNDGESCATKVLIRTDRKTGAKTDLRTGKPFNSYRDLGADLHFWHDYYKDGTGKVYLFSEKNPGERFRSIEFNVKCHGFAVGGANGVTIDNVEVRYVGVHGVGAGTCRDLAVSNCEFAWIGGSIQGEGIFGRDHPTRLGNAVEIYGACDNYKVTNCYVWQVYDAGVTHQLNIPEKVGMKVFDEKNVTYAHNVFEKCNYSIEYFLTAKNGNPSRMENILFEDNLCFDAGYGFCEQRPDRGQAAHVKAWYHGSRNRAKNYVVRRNVFCGGQDMLVQICSGLKNLDGSSSMPILADNVFVGRTGQTFGVISETDGKVQKYGPETPAYVGAFGGGNLFYYEDRKVTLSNDALRVGFDCGTAAFDVTDLRTGRVWRQMPGEGAKVEVKSAAADADGRGASLALRIDGVRGEVRGRLALDGAELSVTLDSDATNRVAKSFAYPYPFEAKRGERLLLPNGCGHAFPVEWTDLGTKAFDKATLWTREMKISAWGQYGEKVAADGSLEGAGGVLALVQTPADATLLSHPRANGLRQSGISWVGELYSDFGYARTIRYVFFAKGSPMEMAMRTRAEMARRGYVVTFAEKRARHPKMAASYDLLAGAPIVWYWELDGDKPGVARRLKELGFENFVFSGVTRRDLNVWITPQEVREIAKVPGVLQTEYDIYVDTMEPSMLDKIDSVRPHWPLEAWDNDDITRHADGTPMRGWKVALKSDPTNPVVGCVSLCAAQARPYMRRRISARLAEAPYGARFFDVTGTSVGCCWNRKHPLTRRTDALARKRMLALPGDEFGLICGTEDGLECYVPEVDYLEGNFSANPYRVDGGRCQWKIYDETPAIIEKGLDPTTRVPFWEMVFHDCIVSTWYWTDYNNKFPKAWWKHDLLNAVTGTPPMYLFTREVFAGIQDRLAASVKVTTPVARATFGVRMTDYRWLTADRLVQQSAFANGVRVTVNFGEKPFTMADGYVLAARGHRFEGLRQ